jgi:hypothetical protein
MARDRILYIFESNEIGRQFFIKLGSPFLGMSLMHALLKLGVKIPVTKQ